MSYTIQIRRQKDPESDFYWQSFIYDGKPEDTIAAVLKEINAGEADDPVAWECGCMEQKCGACAMRINGYPHLACAVTLSQLRKNKVILEPLTKFPVVKDLVIDRSNIHDYLKNIHLWLSEEEYKDAWHHELRYQSAKCLLCGLCLEICPNYSRNGSFYGAIIPVNAFRILNEDQNINHKQDLASLYDQHFFHGCGQSLSCSKVCPVHLPVEELMAESNAAAVWKKNMGR